MAQLGRIRDVLTSDSMVETLAAIEHERWAHWQRYVHGHSEQLEDGSLVIPAHLAQRWEAQMATPYAALSESEKESDREQVRRYLPVLVNSLIVATDPESPIA